MNWLFYQALGQNHPWAIVAHNIAQELIKNGNTVDLFSTNGIDLIPENLKSNIIGYHTDRRDSKINGKFPNSNYDAVFSYTTLNNFRSNLQFASQNRFGMWSFDVFSYNNRDNVDIIPENFVRNYQYCDYLLSPSYFSRKAFINAGIPEDIIKIIPHGFSENFLNDSKLELKTNKRFKILINLGQVHYRKNLSGMLEAYGKAFNKSDDVCLVIKANIKPKKAIYEMDFYAILDAFNTKYPKHGEILILNSFIPDISELYRACNAVLSLSFSEGFLMPGIEALSCKKLLIVSGEGGQKDFISPSNSLIVDGHFIKADPRLYYNEVKNDGWEFSPNVHQAADYLKMAYKEEEKLLNKFNNGFEDIIKKYTWKNSANKLNELITAQTFY